MLTLKKDMYFEVLIEDSKEERCSDREAGQEEQRGGWQDRFWNRCHNFIHEVAVSFLGIVCDHLHRAIFVDEIMTILRITMGQARQYVKN